MKFFLPVTALLLSLSTARASDPVAVYALVDKVVMEPNADQPDRIQIWVITYLTN